MANIWQYMAMYMACIRKTSSIRGQVRSGQNMASKKRDNIRQKWLSPTAYVHGKNPVTQLGDVTAS